MKNTVVTVVTALVFLCIGLTGSAEAQIALSPCTATLANCNGNPVTCRRTSSFVSACAPICAAATPTTAQCTTTEAWYASECGKLEMARIESSATTSTTSKCLAKIRATPRTSYTPVSRLLPNDDFGDAHAATAGAGVLACTTGSGTCNVRHVKGGRPVSLTTSMTRDFHGIMHGQAYANIVALSGQSKLETAHAPWRTNGASSSSCEEYVFHRFEGYSLFEDATLALENDPRQVFTIANTPTATGDNRARRAIGSLNAIQDWSGALLRGSDLFPSGAQPRHEMFGFRFDPAPTIHVNGIDLGIRDPNVIAPNPTLIDIELLEKLEAAQAADEGHRETFAWHRGRSSVMKFEGWSDEYLERLASLRRRFLALMVERAEVLSQSLLCRSPEEHSMLDASGVPAPSPWATRDPVWDPSRPISSSLSVVNLLKSLEGASVVKEMFGGTFLVPVSSSGVEAASFCTPVFTDAIGDQLAAIDAALEAVLHEADTHGCLETGNTPCDWAPSDFVRRTRGLFAVDRQIAYDECVSSVPPGKTLATEMSAVPKTKFCNAGVCAKARHPRTGAEFTCTSTTSTFDYRQNPDTVQMYVSCTRAFKRLVDDKISAALGKHGTYSNTTGAATLAQAFGDAYSAGGDMFGTTASYDASWGLSNMSEANLCTAHTGVGAGASVAVKVLGMSKNLLDARANLKVNEPSGLSVRVLGTEIAGGSLGTFSFAMSPITGNESRSQEFFAVSQVFMVGPFPVRVSASAAGRAGLDYSLEGSCAGSSATMTGTFRPYAAIDAQASAGISAVIAEAGIKIDLVLAQLGLPLKATVVADAASPAPNGRLHLDTQLDLEARFLDGGASLYSEVCYAWPLGCESWDYELFSWSGFRTQTQLFNTEFDVALSPIAGP